MTRIPLAVVVLWQDPNIPSAEGRTTFRARPGELLALVPELASVEITIAGRAWLVPYVDCRRVSAAEVAPVAQEAPTNGQVPPAAGRANAGRPRRSPAV